MTSWQFYFIYLLPVLIYKSTVNGRGPRMLGEPCGEDDELMKCADGLECALKGNGGKMRCRETASMEKETKQTLETDAILERCLHAKCPILFPDCPSDSVPVLSTGPISSDGTDPDGCCQPAIVQCKCDPQKCLVPSCPEATERRMTQKGTEIPGQCCDQFECRTSAELNCENINCPDPKSTFFDLYSPDGQNCPDDSFRPDPYVPAGSCCPIMPHCQCRNGICEPARCNPDQKLVIESRGRGEPGKCCDQFKCLPKNGSNGGECHHEGQIYVVGERWQAAPCQECQCSATGIALCRKMECPTLTFECQWIGFSPGECCPVCLGCRDEEGQTYTIGQNWERDGCTNCTCGTDFHWQCHKFICQTHCENPKPVPGECCPICDEPTIIHESAPICPELADCPLSSFEQGSEQTIFIRPSDNDDQQYQEEQKPTENLSFWLIFALALPILAFILFTIGIAILVIKCKRENTKWMNSNNHEKRPLNWHLNLTNWRNVHMQPFVQENGNKNNLTAKNASLLRTKELSNLL